jgi:glc operon protein GlcG
MKETMKKLVTLFASLLLSITAIAQTPAPTPPAPPAPYGMPITYEQAKKAMAAAETEAIKNNWNVIITIVDSGGNMMMMHRMNSVNIASIKIAEGKATSANNFRRPTKALEDVVAAGGVGLRLLSLGVNTLEGGVPIVIDGKIVGGIGVSGVTSAQDAQIARAGAEAAGK